MRRSKLILFILVSTLYACAEQPKKSEALIPVEERNVPPVKDQHFDSTRDVTGAKDSKTNNSKPQTSVIIALLDEAKSQADKGHSDKAAATIERALRIEPNNAVLWHQLALIRMQQQQWQQAIVLARKSNTLAADNEPLKSENWGIIAEAYEKLGDKLKAKEARQKQKLQG